MCKMQGVGEGGWRGGVRGGDGRDGARPMSATASTRRRSSVRTRSIGANVEIGAVRHRRARGARSATAASSRRARHSSATSASAANVKVGSGTVLGGDPQDLKFKGEHTTVGDRRGHDDPRVHDDQSRHDAVVQDDGRPELLHHVVRAPRARLPRRRRRDPREQRAARGARHASATRRSSRASSAAHQFVKIGQYAFIGGCSRVSQDVPPFVKAVGNPIKLYGLNSVGLQRNGFPEEVRARAQARVPAVLPLGAEHVAGARSARRRSCSRSRRCRRSSRSSRRATAGSVV